MVVKSYLGRVTDMIHSVPVQFMPLDIYHRAQYSPVALCTVEVCLIMHKVNSSLGASLLRVLCPSQAYLSSSQNIMGKKLRTLVYVSRLYYLVYYHHIENMKSLTKVAASGSLY